MGTFLAPAKLNLYLKVVGKRADGYHFIESVMQTIDLFDILDIELIDKEDILITCNEEDIPCDNRNIAYKCAYELFNYLGIKKGVKIDIKKNIPYGAGLGGGSSDGATVIVALNKMLSLNLSLEELIKIGGKVGADIPFLILGGTAKVRGIGEVVERVLSVKNCFFVIVKPPAYVSTKEAYEKIDKELINRRSNFNNILKSIENKDILKMSNYLENDFEIIAPKIIDEVKRKLSDTGAINSLMTGSGPAVFGLFRDEDMALNAKSELKKVYDKVYFARCIDRW